MRLCQASNMAMVVPVAYAIYRRLYWAAGALVASMLLSILYHTNETNELALFADVLGCSIVSSCGFYLILQSTAIVTVWNVLAVVYACAAVTCFSMAGPDTGSDEYDALHSAWHILVVYGITAFLHGHYAQQRLVETAAPRAGTGHVATARTHRPLYGGMQTQQPGELVQAGGSECQTGESLPGQKSRGGPVWCDRGAHPWDRWRRGVEDLVQGTGGEQQRARLAAEYGNARRGRGVEHVVERPQGKERRAEGARPASPRAHAVDPKAGRGGEERPAAEQRVGLAGRREILAQPVAQHLLSALQCAHGASLPARA